MNITSTTQHRIDGATTSSTPCGCADKAAQFEEMGPVGGLVCRGLP